MTRLALLVLLLASVGAFGQQPYGPGPVTYAPPLSPELPKPLKCGKYEHVDYVWTPALTCRNSPCLDTYEPTCAPDMHEVTEKEWQALMERLKRLENVNKSENIQMLDMWVSPEAKDSDYSIVRDSSGKRLTYGQLRKMGKDLQAGRVAGKE